MSNWPIAVATRSETIGIASGTGTTVTAGSANAKGSAATIGTTAFRYSAFRLTIFQTGSTSRRNRLDIIVNNGGADEVILPDVYFENGTNDFSQIFPISIPSGATVKAKLQCTTGSEAAIVAITGFAGDFGMEPGNGRAISCTDWTNTGPTFTVTQTGTTATAWTTIAGSLSNAVSRLWLMPTHAADTGRTVSDFTVEIGIGSAGNEVVLDTAFGHQVSNGVMQTLWELPCDLPAGKRLSFRVTCAAAAADAFGVTALGLAA